MVKINKGNNNQYTDKAQPEKHGRGKAKLEKQTNSKNSSQKFYKRVPHGNMGFAVFAASLQKKIAQEGNIAVKWNAFFAFRAKGTWKYNGFFYGNSENTYIQKTTDTGSKDKQEDSEGHGITDHLQFPC